MAEDAAASSPAAGLAPGAEPFSLDSRQSTLLIAGGCALLASHISLGVVGEHVKHWRRPREQRAIMVILFMVPFFAVDAYFGLADMPGSETVITVLESLRSCYEAWVVSEFLVLLFSYMNISTSSTAPVPDTVKGKVLHNSFPMTLFLGKEMVVDRRTLTTLHALSRQFVVVRPVFSVLQCALLLLGVYHVGVLPWAFLLVFNVSVYLAFYSLLLFYHAFEHELAKHNPLAKFLCVKGVVFLLFWQDLAVRLLVSYKVIHAGHMPFQVRQVEEAVQNFLVCAEMLLASLLFRYAYSATEYEQIPEEAAAATKDAILESIQAQKKGGGKPTAADVTADAILDAMKSQQKAGGKETKKGK